MVFSPILWFCVYLSSLHHMPLAEDIQAPTSSLFSSSTSAHTPPTSHIYGLLLPLTFLWLLPLPHTHTLGPRLSSHQAIPNAPSPVPSSISAMANWWISGNNGCELKTPYKCNVFFIKKNSSSNTSAHLYHPDVLYIHSHKYSYESVMVLFMQIIDLQMQWEFAVIAGLFLFSFYTIVELWPNLNLGWYVSQSRWLHGL